LKWEYAQGVELGNIQWEGTIWLTTKVEEKRRNQHLAIFFFQRLNCGNFFNIFIAFLMGERQEYMFVSFFSTTSPFEGVNKKITKNLIQSRD
jgi:hypothetical protein